MYTDAVWLIHLVSACAICTGGFQVLLAIAAIVCRDACCRRVRRRGPAAPST